MPALAPVEVSISAHASVENANRLDGDDIDFGFMASNWIGRAKNGEAPFTQKIDLRMVAPMNAGPLFFIARADSDLRTVTDLRGRRLVVGPEQSGMAQHARVILGALGLTFADFTPIFLDFAAGAEALERGEADAQLQCPIPNKVMTALAARVLAARAALRTGRSRHRVARRAVLSPHRDAQRRDPRPRCRRGAGRRRQCAGDARARRRGQSAATSPSAIFAARDELPRLNALFDGIGELFEPLRSDGAARARIRRRRAASRRGRGLSGGRDCCE